MEDKYLKHYGIPGMRWGIRKYQDKQGGLTSLGRQRYGVNKKSRESRNEYWFKQNQRGGKDKPPVSRAEIAARKGIDATDAAKNAASAASRLKRGKPHPELNSMSNKEIQDAINRMNLERQYSSLKDGDVRNGFDVARDILEIVGSTVAIGTAAVGLYSLVKNVPK